MGCFGGCTSPDIFQNCCKANTLCEFDGSLDKIVSEPIFVQKVFDAVLFNLQGLKTVSNQCFSPAIPRGHRLKRVVDIRCKRYFNPENVEDPANLKLNIDTTISGASFIQHANGDDVTVVGPDGTYSEKVIYADTRECDEKGKGTPIFGTQNIAITGDVQVCLDLLLCDRYDHEVIFTVCANVNVAQECSPLFLTNFFELCMPSTLNTAFLPRFAEFCNPLCESRLATNNMGRDLTLCPDGTIKANLIIALCITCEKKLIVPVQLCVLSTGYVQMAPQVSAICTTFPQLFPDQIQATDDDEEEEEEESEVDDCEIICCEVPCNPPFPPSPPPRRR
ncbi:MAG: hypothetical protein ACOX4U_08600 [Anaerovoracaceae bacterium]|jgi:hypothetical protein